MDLLGRTASFRHVYTTFSWITLFAGKAKSISFQRLLVAGKGFALVSRRSTSWAEIWMSRGALSAFQFSTHFQLHLSFHGNLFIKDCRFRSVQDHRLRSFEKVPRKAKLWFAAWLNGFQFSFIHLATRFQNIFSKLANFGSDFQHLRVPCLTRARAGVDAFWATSHGRFRTLKDWNFLSKTVYSNIERLKVSNVSFCKIGIENSLLLSNRLGKSGPSRMVDFGQRCWGSFGEAIWNGSGKCLANSSGSADPSPARPSYGLVRMRSKKRWEKRKGGDPRKETSYKFHNISPFELQYIIICSPI